ncbi:MAG TPA: DUF899 family protein [bacterium]|nr:DUF899 family protein [bacterium]
MPVTHSFRFPGESAPYRQARNALLQAEVDLQKRVVAVAEMRSRLPLGGVAQDYVFEEGAADLAERGTVRQVKLSQLFAPGKDTLALYSFMYGPEMAEACPMCTSFLDGMSGNAVHIQQRCNLAVVAKSPVQRIREHARSRGWNLRMLSSAHNTYNRDYFGEEADGSQITMMNVFVRRGGAIHHFYGSEARFVPEPGHDPCHIDLMWPLWNVLDLTPEGRGDWYPSLTY